jgi:hypothetical protein
METEDRFHSTGEVEGSSLSGERPREWYDDDFCPGGGKIVGKDHGSAVCPVCGEVMDVDEDGYLFKHRPRIPGNPR